MDLIGVRTSAEKHEWLTVHNAAVAARNWPASGLRTLLTRSENYRHILARSGELPLGAALAVMTDARATAWISVLPACREQGVGSLLWGDLRAWAHAAAASTIETRVEAEDSASVSFARTRGLTVVREEPRLVFDLAAPAPERCDSELRLVALEQEPELIDGAYRVFRRTTALARTITRDAWQRQMLAAEAAGSQHATVALLEAGVVGYGVLTLLASRPDVAAHNGTFVHPDFKRLGIASAIKAEQIAWARAAGFARLEASSDPGNVAKMRLYSRIGYRRVPGWYVMRLTMGAPV